jgi:alpha-N-acetylglucosaminidase
MINIRCCKTLFLAAAVSVSLHIANAGTVDVAEGLIERIVPVHSAAFVIESIPAENGHDVFEIESRDGKIVLRGNNGIAQASAFNWYLKHFAGGEISIRGDQLSLPDQLPLPTQKIRKVTPYAVRGQMNYCTFCYTAAFWGWSEWEREIDRMAMSGVNVPLMCIGNEKVWQNVLERLGYRNEDIRKFIPGSAYTAWWLMGNLEGEGGPVSQTMIDRESELAQKILARMRAYGMEPILQGFCGLVPTTFSSYYPSANVIPQGQWGDYVRPSVLSPQDPLFPKVAAVWYEEQAKLYGNAKYYGGDLFHEGGNADGLSLAACARAVQSAQQQHAPGAVWVLQGWSGNPKPELLAATCPEQVLVQQVSAYPQQVSLSGFQERPWVFASVNDFGGHESFGGVLKPLATMPGGALQQPNHHLVGIALLDEGLDAHPILWDMFSDSVWATQNIDLINWCEAYPHYRYGQDSVDTAAAWRIIGSKVMANPARENLLCAMPSMDIRSTSTWGNCDTLQNPMDMINAAELLLKAAAPLREVPTYRHDCVDAVRQVMQDYGYYLYHAMMENYKTGNRTAFKKNLQQFHELLGDMDELLASEDHFLLGKWIEMARKKGATKVESDQYEKMARQLVTLWTARETVLSDYAYKNWSGLYRDYYNPRWDAFLSKLDRSLDDPTIKPIFDGESNEVAWVAAKKSYSTVPVGDAIALSKRYFSKYGDCSRIIIAAHEAEARRWSWSLANSVEKNQILSWDVTDRVVAGGVGTYRVLIKWQSGANAILTHGVDLDKTVAMAIDSEEIAGDGHLGRSDATTKDNFYTLKIDKVVAGAKYLLRVKAEGDIGNDSHGYIQFQKWPEAAVAPTKS